MDNTNPKEAFEIYKTLREGKDLILNLGCGHRNGTEAFGIDCQDLAGVNLVWDLTTGIPYSDKTFDVIIARDFLEHIQQGIATVKIMEEINRVLKVSGNFEFEVPSTDGCNIGAFQDPTHISFWNQTKFLYFLADEHGKGFRGLNNIKCWFKPTVLMTYNNEHGVTYVYGKLTKEVLNG